MHLCTSTIFVPGRKSNAILSKELSSLVPGYGTGKTFNQATASLVTVKRRCPLESGSSMEEQKSSHNTFAHTWSHIHCFPLNSSGGSEEHVASNRI